MGRPEKYQATCNEGAVRRIRDFGTKVAAALGAKGIPSTIVYELQTPELYTPKKKLFSLRQDPLATRRRTALLEGWLLAEQRTQHIVWRDPKNFGGASKFEDQGFEFYLGLDGAFTYVEVEHIHDHRLRDTSGPPYDNTYRKGFAATLDQIGRLDYDWQIRHVRDRNAHDYDTWERRKLLYDSFGVGLSSRVRSLADKHGVAPRHER